ncbi:MAG: hypothetical protein WD036_03585 [Bauldia sp.]
MRGLLVAAVLSGGLAAAASAMDDIDAATLDRVFAAATRDYPQPADAVVRNVHKSRAANGSGYCGEIGAADGSSFTVFHVLLESALGPSALRLADFPESDQSNDVSLVRLMMRNFGCVE